MLDVRAEWNQPCRSNAGLSKLYLGLRIRPGAAEGSTPVNIVVLLDVSTSMDGEKLENARLAVRQVWDKLGLGDRLYLLTFSSRVTHRLEWAEKGQIYTGFVSGKIDECEVEGVTLLGAGLTEAIRVASAAPAAGPRFIWLVTDGHPTNSMGGRVENLEPFLAAAAQGASQGLSIGALGLGDAQDYRFGFLRDLADKGQGEVCYAPDPQELSQKLAEQLEAAKAVTATQGRVEITLSEGAEVLSAGRVGLTSSYMPLDLPGGRGSWSIPIGRISTPETIVLLEVAHTAFGDTSGDITLGQATVSATIRGERYTLPTVPIRLEIAQPGSRKVFDRSQTMENMRVAMLIARAAQLRANTNDLGAKARATDDMADLARASGDIPRALKLEAEAEKLRAGRKPSADEEARAEMDGRGTGPILLRQEK
jgi:hypothetical protein